MKSCPYCGTNYPNDLIVCPTDGNHLALASEMPKGGAGVRRTSKFWVLFNTLCRIGGAGFLINGTVFAVWGLSLVLNPKSTMMVNGIPTRDPWAKCIMLVMGMIVGLLGLLLLVSKRYRPDLGDRAFSSTRR
jgi:hypothetical protein